MKSFIVGLDMWEQVPTLYYSKDHPSMKTFLSGIIFFISLTLGTGFFVIQLTDFIQNLDTVSSSRIVESKSLSYNLTFDDLYLGAGILYKNSNGDFVPLPYSNYSQFFSINFILHLNNQSQFLLPKGDCYASGFYFQDEWNRMNATEKNLLEEKIKGYTCFADNYSLFLEHNDLLNSESYFQVSVDIIKSNFTQAMDFLGKNILKIQMIYSNFFVDVSNRYLPLSSYIDFLNVYLDAAFIKKFTLSIIPFAINDDTSRLTNVKYELYHYYKNETDDMGNYFLVQQGYQKIQHVPNRTTKQLNLNHYEFNLSIFSRNVYRDYNKFSTFLAETNTIIFSIFEIVCIFCHFFNTHYMQYFMTRKINDSAFLTRLCDDLYISPDEKRKRRAEKEGSTILKRVSALSSVSEKPPDDLPEKLTEMIRTKPKFYNNNTNTASLNENEAIERYLNSYVNNCVGTSNICFIFGLCQQKKQKYNDLTSRLKRVSSILNIDKYIQLHNEFESLKKLLFNNRQILSFELVTRLENSDYNPPKDESAVQEYVFAFKKSLQSSEDKDVKIVNLLRKLISSESPSSRQTCLKSPDLQL